MISPLQLKKIIELLLQEKTLVISFQKSKNQLHIKELTMSKINID